VQRRVHVLSQTKRVIYLQHKYLLLLFEYVTIKYINNLIINIFVLKFEKDCSQLRLNLVLTFLRLNDSS